jgi:hypothetical protein
MNYFKFQIETNVLFSPAFTAAQKAKLKFIDFPSSCLVEYGCRWVTYLPSNYITALML